MDKDRIIRYFSYNRKDCYTWQKNLGKPLTRTVVEIPARGGSTRVINKNIADVCGLPLLAYTIKIAKSIKAVDRVIVNTDSPEYAEIARKHGAEVPFLRPKEFSGKKASLAESSFFMRRWLYDEGYPVRRIITLLPTSPFRNLEVLNYLVSKLQHFWCVNSFYPTDTLNSQGLYIRSENSDFMPVDVDKADVKQIALKQIGFFSGIDIQAGKGKSIYSHIIRNPFEAIDVDTDADLKIVRHLIKNKLYDFGMNICPK